VSKEKTMQHGIISAPQPEAVEAGADVLAAGGNAVAAPRFCTTSNTIDITSRMLRRTANGWDGGADPGRDGMVLRL
jgi:hypothetical protein